MGLDCAYKNKKSAAFPERESCALFFNNLCPIKATTLRTRRAGAGRHRKDRFLWLQKILPENTQKIKAAKFAKASNLTEAESYAYAWGMSAAY